MRVALLTTLAMLAFAANSLLARLGLVNGDAEAFGYTGIRLASGALVLALILYFNERSRGGTFRIGGSWAGGGALFGYALAFSIAYLVLGAGSGALILFASVQFGILGWAILKGDRPGLLEWLGIAIAFAALIVLLAPGLVAPDPVGAALMIFAGLCWAAYTLIGRGSASPLTDTAGNFIRCVPVALVLIVIGLAMQAPTWKGVILAIASGAVASGLGYAIWYAVLPSLTRTRSGLVQLTVPAIAAIGGVLFIAEPLTTRLVLSSCGILGGVALALYAAERRRQQVL
jgi:drug/metabolite transporter (DMT)-like permease